MSTLPATNPVQLAVAGLVDSLTDLLEGHDNDTDRLFAVLVEAVELYVTAAAANTSDAGGCLGEREVDAAVFSDPSLLANYEAARRSLWVKMTAQSLVENLAGR